MTKVSVIMPTLDGAKYIRQAVLSVLDQTFRDIELIIINDGSQDETENIINDLLKKDPRIIYLKNEKSCGLQKTLNTGLIKARGEYITRIDDDDFWNDMRKLEKQIGYMEAEKDCVLLGTNMHAISENGDKLYDSAVPENDKSIRKNLLFQTSFIHSSVCFRKLQALNFGGYSEDPDVRHIEDYDLWLKLGTVGKLHNIPDYSVTIRLRSGSVMGKNIIDRQRKSIRLIKRLKDHYPGYYKALGLAYLRLILRILIGYKRK